MSKLLSSILPAVALFGCLAVPVMAPASAQQHSSDQQRAREEMRAGRNMPLRDIERRVIPQMEGREYLGPEYDQAASAYRLKFIDKNSRQIIWVDVDARNAKILRISR